MKRKGIMSILILFILCLSVSTVGAGFLEDLGFRHDSIGLKNGILTINDIDFKIPEGYEEDMDAQMLGEPVRFEGMPEMEGLFLSSAVYNDTNSSNTITMEVIYFGNGSEITSIGYNDGTNKTINGVEGYMDNVDNETLFTYIKDGKIVTVYSSTDENIFDKIVM